MLTTKFQHGSWFAHHLLLRTAQLLTPTGSMPNSNEPTELGLLRELGQFVQVMKTATQR